MKIFRRILLGIVSLIVLLILVIVIFYRQEAFRLYKVVTLFDAGTISENFRNMKGIFPVKTIRKSPVPYYFASQLEPISLPETFMYNDSVVNTQDYLDYTLTDALLILHHDTIKYENYSNGFTESDQHISWSMSKSVISALFGIAIEEGYIQSIEQTVTDYLPDFRQTGYDGVRIKNVLQMSSGVGFNEDYGDFNSDINVMGRYFATGMAMRDFAKRLKREKEPGTFNHYVSIDTQVLGMILTEATGKSVTEYMEEKLWAPIGAEFDAYWIMDDTAMEFVLGGLNATVRDYAKLGLLYLDSGRWLGKQLVPEDWVIASVTPDAPHLQPGRRANSSHKDGYGFQWWIPLGAEDEFNAQGIYSQFIYVDPDKEIVIVKLSSNYHFKNDSVGFFHDHEIALYRTIVAQLANKNF